MTSVQSASAVLQGGGTLPPGIKPQDVRNMYTKYQQMKLQGVPETDPEYVRLHTILTAVQQDQAARKNRQAYAQQQRQQQQQQQQNGAGGQTVTNGINGRAPNVTGPSHSPNQSVAVSSASPPAGQAASSGASVSFQQQSSTQKSGSQGHGPFTAEQLAILRNQIFSFKILSRNLPIPPNVQQQLFGFQQGKRSQPVAQAVAAAGHVLDSAAQGQNGSSVEAGADKSEATKQRNGYETFTSPYSHLRRAISYADHASRETRLMIPSIMPSGVDIDRVREERERIVYNRIMARKSELERLPANLAVWDTSKRDAPNGDDSLKLKALLEYKMLCLLPKQRALRQQVSRDMVQYDNLAMTANRTMYRRMKKQSLREARITEKLEKQQRDARESREKKKHYDYLQSVLSHCREIQTAAQTQKARVQKLGRMMMQHHQHIEKEEQKRVERTAKQRLQALKANDEEAYLKLLDQAKDTRITHLLKQTDGFLSQLAASVKQQQRSAAERYGNGDYPDDLDDDDDDDDEEDSRKVDYYQVAHRIQETISEQPGILVGGTLKEYQIKGLQWMISLYNNNLNGILADEMGLGKTIQTISLITYLIEKKKQNGPFLVIVPLSTLTNWNLEFDKWAPSVTKVVYKGPPNARKQQQQAIRWGQFQVLLTTYEYIIRDRPVLSKIKWMHMIVDEGHRMKNSQSKLSSTLTQYYNSRYRLILTGTPLQNNLPELWALLNFVLPTIFKSVKSFDEWFNTPFANTGSQDKMELSEEEQLLVIRRLHKVLRPFLLRRLKKDVEKDLPDKQERVIKCKFSALQARLYKQMVSHNMLFVNDPTKGGKTGIRGLSNMLMQLRKLCNHPFVFEEVEEQMNPSKVNDDLLWRTAGKFELLDRVLPKFKATGHRVLMFFQMTAIMNIMEDFLRLRGYQYLRLDGSTKSDDRSELLKLFNAPNSPYFCFLLSTRAGGLGLNLQTADTVIIYDSDWNPHQDLQAQDRAHRIGQKNEVRILRLISSNSVEEKILERAQFKLDMDGKVIQAGKFDNKSTNEERDALLRVMLETAEATDNMADEEMDDDDLNMLMMRSEDELVVFKKLDDERERDPKYGPNRKFQRLLQESELPDIYLMDENPVVEEIEEHAGRGARERNQVKYDDGLTEEQWLEAVDNDDDTIEAAMARKQEKMKRRENNKLKKEKKGGGLAASPERDSSEPPIPKKRGRKPKGEKRKAEEAVMDEVPPPSKRKRGRQPKSNSVADPLSAEERKLHQRIFSNVYNALMNLTAPVDPEDDEDDEQRNVIDPFVSLPPKAHYPDYYMVIPRPIAMNMIKKKIDREEYSSLKEFRDDIRTLCNNARTYNEDGSLLFEDANAIEAECIARIKEETEDHPDLADFDEPNSSVADGQSTAPISSAGTPLASSSMPKMKLTFNASYRNGGDSERQSDDE